MSNDVVVAGSHPAEVGSFMHGTLKEKKTLGKNTVGEIDCDIN